MRAWGVRLVRHPWSHILTLGIHIDPRHPMVEFHLGPFILGAGRFYVTEDGRRVCTDPEDWEYAIRELGKRGAE